MTRKISWSAINDWLWQTTSAQEVTKDLSDTKWDWLRSRRGLGAVIALSFFVIFVAPVIVWFVDDGIGVIPLVMVAGVFVVWFLLRRSVRLVADAPDDALDERLMAIRNRIYLSAYRALATVLGFIGVAILFWAFQADDSGIITTTLSLTWPQTNAVIWFLYGQILIWPSLVLAIAIRQRKVLL
jgi:uncharacterized Tic20 family protein